MTEANVAEPESFEQHIVIGAPPATVFACFFSPDALRVWWQAARSVTTPTPFGVASVIRPSRERSAERLSSSRFISVA